MVRLRASSTLSDVGSSENVAPRGCQRLASVIRFAQIEAATAQGPNGRQGVDHIPEITAMEERLQVAR
jgi:hypothetical protein